MMGKHRLFLLWGIGACLILGAFYAAVAWLWSTAEESRAASLESQVVSALTTDLAEGNLFKLGATLSRLQQDEHLRFAEIRHFQNNNKDGVIFRTQGSSDQTDAIFSKFRCGEQGKIVRYPIGGVNLITTLPSKIAGSECVALFISSDLPPDLKRFKNRLVASSGILVVALLGFFLWFTMSWYQRILNLEIANRVMQVEKESAIGRIAAQVAHDIRSPLAALDSVVKDVSQLPEEKRIIIRSAVGRIRDIANHLLEKNRAIKAADKNSAAGSSDAASESTTVQLLSSLIDPLITEKRLQFRSKIGIEIDSRLDASSYGLFAEVQPVEFKRTLSNLINNSVEAMDKGGSVIVGMSQEDGKVFIKVEDNGKGIPPEILAKLGQRGETHGKAGGSGLGLYHARTSVEKWGGGLEVASEPGRGTTITISIPAAKPPEWFVSELRLEADSAVVVLDDDTSIHQVWQGRLDSLNVKNSGIEVFHFSTPEDFRGGAKSLSDFKNTVFLADYELIGHKETGLSLAEELNIGSRTILVTSRYEEKQILENCIRLKVRMIPKGLAGLVPIAIHPQDTSHQVTRHQVSGKADNSPLITGHSSLITAVLIDDDPLVHMTWKISARNKGIAFKAFKKPADFLAANPDTGTAVYVDSDLGDGIKGEEFSKTLFEKGYKTIYLATGHTPESFPPMPHIKKVIGKEPPWE